MFGNGTVLDVSPLPSPEDHAALRALGHDVVVCSGPGTGGCPLVEAGTCPLADSADGVVFRLDLDTPYHRTLLAAYRTATAGTSPLHVVVESGGERRHASVLDGLAVTCGALGAGLPRLSSQVSMAASARSGVFRSDEAWFCDAG